MTNLAPGSAPDSLKRIGARPNEKKTRSPPRRPAQGRRSSQRGRAANARSRGRPSRDFEGRFRDPPRRSSIRDGRQPGHPVAEAPTPVLISTSKWQRRRTARWIHRPFGVDMSCPMSVLYRGALRFRIARSGWPGRASPVASFFWRGAFLGRAGEGRQRLARDRGSPRGRRGLVLRGHRGCGTNRA